MSPDNSQNCRNQRVKGKENLSSEETEELILRDKEIITQRAAVAGGITCN